MSYASVMLAIYRSYKQTGVRGSTSQKLGRKLDRLFKPRPDMFARFQVVIAAALDVIQEEPGDPHEPEQG